MLPRFATVGFPRRNHPYDLAAHGVGDHMDPPLDAPEGEPPFLTIGTARVLGAKLIASLLLYGRDKRGAKRGVAVLAELEGLPMNDRERAHLRALRAARDGDLAGARDVYDSLLQDSPRDAVALWAAQVIDYYLGDSNRLRTRVVQALSAEGFKLSA